MVYDYMSEGNGPVPLELKVRIQLMPPPKPTTTHTLRSHNYRLPRNLGSQGAKLTRLGMDKTSERANAVPQTGLGLI